MKGTRPGPRGLPDLRSLLLGQWQPGNVFAESTTAQRVLRGSPSDESWSHDVPPPGTWERRTLTSAQLWWVSDEMTDLLDAAAPSIPGVPLTPEVMPALAGLVRFAHPLQGVDSEHEEDLTVDAMQWGTITLPPRRGSREGTAGIGIASYRLVNIDMLHAELKAREQRDPSARGQWYSNDIPVKDDLGSVWVPLGRADWCLGDDPDSVAFDTEIIAGETGDPIDLQTHLSMVEDRRRMLALWVLSAQPGVATRRVERGDRADRRRAARAGLPEPDVQVIHLRRPPTREESDGSGVNWSHRWIVNGHWRNQPYGPARTLRRPQWIAPFTKGPEDKPLVVNEKVRSWTR